jgi:hypothetical protein
MSLGGDLLLPLGASSETARMGYGGTVRPEYAFMPNSSITMTAGYFNWSGKDIAGIGRLPDVKGIPALVEGKYYFSPEGESVLMLWLSWGAFIPSGSTSSGGSGSSGDSETKTVFAITPIVGVDFLVRNVTGDSSVRYFLLTGSASNSDIGLRLGLKFPIGR